MGTYISGGGREDKLRSIWIDLFFFDMIFTSLLHLAASISWYPKLDQIVVLDLTPLFKISKTATTKKKTDPALKPEVPFCFCQYSHLTCCAVIRARDYPVQVVPNLRKNAQPYENIPCIFVQLQSLPKSQRKLHQSLLHRSTCTLEILHVTAESTWITYSG